MTLPRIFVVFLLIIFITLVHITTADALDGSNVPPSNWNKWSVYDITADRSNNNLSGPNETVMDDDEDNDNDTIREEPLGISKFMYIYGYTCLSIRLISFLIPLLLAFLLWGRYRKQSTVTVKGQPSVTERIKKMFLSSRYLIVIIILYPIALILSVFEYMGILPWNFFGFFLSISIFIIAGINAILICQDWGKNYDGSKPFKLAYPERWNPGIWVLPALFFWQFFVPLYLYMRWKVTGV